MMSNVRQYGLFSKIRSHIMLYIYAFITRGYRSDSQGHVHAYKIMDGTSKLKLHEMLLKNFGDSNRYINVLNTLFIYNVISLYAKSYNITS